VNDSGPDGVSFTAVTDTVYSVPLSRPARVARIAQPETVRWMPPGFAVMMYRSAGFVGTHEMRSAPFSSMAPCRVNVGASASSVTAFAVPGGPSCPEGSQSSLPAVSGQTWNVYDAPGTTLAIVRDVTDATWVSHGWFGAAMRYPVRPVAFCGAVHETCTLLPLWLAVAVTFVGAPGPPEATVTDDDAFEVAPSSSPTSAVTTNAYVPAPRPGTTALSVPEPDTVTLAVPGTAATT
jgi:hypothetical protein